MKLTAILATDLRGGLGYKGALPWPRMRRDLQRFKAATEGKVCLVGRTTYDSLPPLPGRRLVVLSRRASPADLPRAEAVAPNFDAALVLACHEPEVMVIGGASVYNELLLRCDRLLLTVVHGEYKADVHCPAPTMGFERISVETFDPDPHTPARVTFSEWVRR